MTTKQTSRLLATLFAVAIISATAFAGDYADLKFIGFSANGRFMAFEESGVYDGAGGEYATTYYVDVDNNKYAQKPTTFEFEDDTMKPAAKAPLRAQYRNAVNIALRKLGIVRGNTGAQVVAHLLTDWSNVKPVETDSYWNRNGQQTTKKMPNYEGAFLSRGDDTETVIFNPWLYVNNINTDSFYQLTLKKILDKGGACTADDAYKIELTLQDNSQHRDVAPQLLQRDASIPKARNCPYGYRIEQVYFYKNRLAVFLNVFSQGFEGPDMRYMAITGKLNEDSMPPG